MCSYTPSCVACWVLMGLVPANFGAKDPEGFKPPQHQRIAFKARRLCRKRQFKLALCLNFVVTSMVDHWSTCRRIHAIQSGPYRQYRPSRLGGPSTAARFEDTRAKLGPLCADHIDLSSCWADVELATVNVPFHKHEALADYQQRLGRGQRAPRVLHYPQAHAVDRLTSRED